MSRAFPLFVFAVSATVLGTVLAAQYWGGLLPCELCLKERWPWDAAIVVGFVAAMTGSRPAQLWVALIVALIFLVGSGLAFYHVGVEQHWFAGPTACTAGGAPTTLAALRALIEHQQAVRCDEPAWTLFGVSLAGWNLVASLIMAALAVTAFLRHRPRPGHAGLGRGIVL
jgi:disulfide bond formation protein DsbB